MDSQRETHKCTVYKWDKKGVKTVHFCSSVPVWFQPWLGLFQLRLTVNQVSKPISSYVRKYNFFKTERARWKFGWLTGLQVQSETTNPILLPSQRHNTFIFPAEHCIFFLTPQTLHQGMRHRTASLLPCGWGWDEWWRRKREKYPRASLSLGLPTLKKILPPPSPPHTLQKQFQHTLEAEANWWYYSGKVCIELMVVKGTLLGSVTNNSPRLSTIPLEHKTWPHVSMRPSGALFEQLQWDPEQSSRGCPPGTDMCVGHISAWGWDAEVLQTVARANGHGAWQNGTLDFGETTAQHWWSDSPLLDSGLNKPSNFWSFGVQVLFKRFVQCSVVL